MKLLSAVLLMLNVVLFMPLGSHADAEFYGVIESRPEGKVGTWKIGGQQVIATEKTKLEEEHGPLAIGACAEVEYDGNAVEEIESKGKQKCGK